MTAPVSIIMGLGREVGVACARYFREEGHHVVVASPVDDTIEKAETNLGDGYVFHHGDLHTQIGIRNCLTAAIEAHGRHDNLVIIPPMPSGSSVASLDLQALDKATATGARSAALALSLFAQAMAEQEPLSPDEPRQAGSITFVLGLAATLVNPGEFLASATQSATLGVVRAGAIDLAGTGIRVNAVCALRPRATNDEGFLKQRTPLGRAATSEEIARAAFYLASPMAAIITGQTLVLDGGRTHLNGTLDDT